MGGLSLSEQRQRKSGWRDIEEVGEKMGEEEERETGWNVKTNQ